MKELEFSFDFEGSAVKMNDSRVQSGVRGLLAYRED
jgi:hypothetical protein